MTDTNRPNITVTPPGPDSPGFLRRIITLGNLQERMEAGDLTAMDDVVSLLLPHVTVEGYDLPEGSNLDPRREALLDLSQTEFESIFGAFASGGKSQTTNDES